MKKIININLSSRLIPIEDSAYDLLKSYLEVLKKYFTHEEGRDEIIGDIESRIAEIFQEILKKGAHCITDENVNGVIASMGRPEQFDGDQPQPKSSGETTAPEEYYYSKPKKRLFRDPDDKILGGVCSGLAAYFDVDPIIFRLIFAAMFFGWGSGLILYIILWIAMPLAKTSAEKLEMRGERVDLNNIKNTVKEEMSSLKGKMEGMGNEVRNFSVGRGRQIGNDLGELFRKVIEGIGSILVFLAKGIVYFVAVVILVSLIGVGIFLTASSAALYPLKNFFLAGFFENALFVLFLILVVGIPVLSLIIFAIRKLAGIKYRNRVLGYCLTILWVIGVIGAFALVTFIVRDFRMYYQETIPVVFAQPSNRQLTLRGQRREDYFSGFNLWHHELNVIDDSVTIRNVQLRIERSPADTVSMDITRTSSGYSRNEARILTHDIIFNLNQDGSVLEIPHHFTIPLKDHFRNQHLTLRIYLPLHYSLIVDPYIHSLMKGNYSDLEDQENTDPRDDIHYIMTSDGLQRVDQVNLQPDTLRIPQQVPKNSSSSTRRYHYQGPDGNTPASPSGNSAGQNNAPLQLDADGISFLFFSIQQMSQF
ncbi:MAG: PspC domain-containing protein [Chitinophagaceae bacterium]